MAMPMDVWQTDGDFHVCLDLPGVDSDSVEITTERNVLTIKAERRPEYQECQNVMIAERPQGSFTRQLQMSDSLDTENIEASLRRWGTASGHPDGSEGATAPGPGQD